MIPKPLRVPLLLLLLSVASSAAIVTHQYVRRAALQRQVVQAEAQIDRLQRILEKNGRRVILPPDDD